mmetsp:Transcript_21547/g.35334  ORF Transcript_21547/g.35334 Transcript_21547/m.35334 type:complete len:82 (+) Transcript_21547:306-551(+)
MPNNESNSTQNPPKQQKPQRFSHFHASTYSLRHLFTAAHYTFKPSKYTVQQGNDNGTPYYHQLQIINRTSHIKLLFLYRQQ